MEPDKFNSLLRLMDIGDENALIIIQREYGRQIKWAAYSILNDWHHTKDVLNEVLSTLWAKSKKFRNIKNPDACIYDLARKAAYSFYRKYLKKHRNEVQLENITKKDEEKFLVHNDDHSDINFFEIISSLNDVDREIIIRKMLFGFSHEQIGKDLSIPKSTVSWKYQAILDTLKEKLQKEDNSS